MEYEEQTKTKTKTNIKLLSKLTSLSLSEAIRPTTFEQYVGQDHLINPIDGAIRNFIKLGYLPSMIFTGPSGIGKTTLASVISYECGLPFLELSATTMTTMDLKTTIMQKNQKNQKNQNVGEQKIVLFIDELHRLTKIQQDWLLPYLENGEIVLIGATTIQPNTRIRQAILSRCQVFKLEKLTRKEIKKVLCQAITFQNLKRKHLYQLGAIVYDDDDEEQGDGLDDGVNECFDLILDRAQGDCRIAINLIELISDNFLDNVNDIKLLKNQLQKIFHSLNYNNNNNNLGDHIIVDDNDIMRNFIKVLAHGCFKSKKIYNNNKNKNNKNKNSLEFIYDDFKTQNFENHYLQQMQVSDDSDVETGDIYSEDEDKQENLLKMDQLEKGDKTDDDDDDDDDAYRLISALFYLNLLLQKGQSPNMIFRQLILFTIKYIECDNFTLKKLLSFKKAIGNKNNDTERVLSNCVEWLMYQKRTVDGIYLSDYISYIKTYCNKQMELDAEQSSGVVGSGSGSGNGNNIDGVEISYESDDIELAETFPEFPDPPNSLIDGFEVEYI